MFSGYAGGIDPYWNRYLAVVGKWAIGKPCYLCGEILDRNWEPGRFITENGNLLGKNELFGPRKDRALDEFELDNSEYKPMHSMCHQVMFMCNRVDILEFDDEGYQDWRRYVIWDLESLSKRDRRAHYFQPLPRWFEVFQDRIDQHYHYTIATMFDPEYAKVVPHDNWANHLWNFAKDECVTGKYYKPISWEMRENRSETVYNTLAINNRAFIKIKKKAKLEYLWNLELDRCRLKGLCIPEYWRYEAPSTFNCMHGDLYVYCSPCMGRYRCIHGKLERSCALCNSEIRCRSHETHETGCEALGNKKYDMYCIHCFSNLFPNNPRTANIRKASKENKWVSKLTNHPDLSRFKWVHDKPLSVSVPGSGCDSRRRIDLHCIHDGVLIAIEIDEDQHKQYDEQCEKVRQNELYSDYAGRQLFVRINPDTFKRGRKRLDPPFEERLERVVNYLKETLPNLDMVFNNDSLVETEKFFFDGYEW